MKIKSANQAKFNKVRPAFSVKWSQAKFDTEPFQGQYGTCALLAASMQGSYEIGRNRFGVTVYRFTFYSPEVSYDETAGTTNFSQGQRRTVQVNSKQVLQGGAIEGAWAALETAWARVNPDALLNGGTGSEIMQQITGQQAQVEAATWLLDDTSKLDIALASGKVVLFSSDVESKVALTTAGGQTVTAIDYHAYRVFGSSASLSFQNPHSKNDINNISLSSLVAQGESYGNFYISQ